MRWNFVRIAPFAMLIVLAIPLASAAQDDAQQPPKNQGQDQQGNSQQVQQGQGQTPQEPSVTGPRDQTSKDAIPRSDTRKTPPPVKPEDVIFSPRDQQLIRQWFLMNGTDVTLGLAKRDGGLPPGTEQQLKRNRVLPPNLQKRIDVFPLELARQMSEIPKEYSRGILGVYALILDRHFKIMDATRFR